MEIVTRFKDLKEVCGLGKQQVRNLESNLACFQILAMNYAIVELWAWDKDATFLTRHRPPWDEIARPPHRKKQTNGAANRRTPGVFFGEICQNPNPKNIKLNNLKKRLFDQIAAV